SWRLVGEHRLLGCGAGTGHARWRLDRQPGSVRQLLSRRAPLPGRRGDEQERSHPSEASQSAPWPLDAWPDVQTKFVLCTEDRFLPPDFLRRLIAERLHITPDEILAGHCVALSRTKELAQ